MLAQNLTLDQQIQMAEKSFAKAVANGHDGAKDQFIVGALSLWMTEEEAEEVVFGLPAADILEDMATYTLEGHCS